MVVVAILPTTRLEMYPTSLSLLYQKIGGSKIARIALANKPINM